MKILNTLIILLFTITCFNVEAKEYKVDEIPLVHLQDKRRYVSNPDNIISQEAVLAMDTTLYALEQKTGIQTLVVVVSGIEGGDCFDFAQQLGQKNGVGEKKRDNGLVILLSTDERCVQFATGYGIEGDLPDAICKRIQTKYMLPYFRQGDWSNGMLAGVMAVRSYLDGSMQRENSGDDEDVTFILIFVVTLILIILGALFTVWWHKRCPACKKHNIQRVSSILISKENGTRTDAVTYKCLSCGHTFVRNEKSADHDYRGPRGGSGGPIIFGGFGGRRGGGGFGGGSFGGGSFGGGGAGSRF